MAFEDREIAGKCEILDIDLQNRFCTVTVIINSLTKGQSKYSDKNKNSTYTVSFSNLITRP